MPVAARGHGRRGRRAGAATGSAGAAALSEAVCGRALFKAECFPDEEVLSLMLLNALLFWVCFSAAPDGPPMDVTLQPMTSQSIQVTWKVSGAGAARGLSLAAGAWAAPNAVPSLCGGSSSWDPAFRRRHEGQEELPGQNENLKAGRAARLHRVGSLLIMFYNKLVIS